LNNPETMEKINKLRWLSGGLKMLHSLLTVLDDEKLVVIHTEEEKGYVVSISGVTDNHQLQILLADVLMNLPEVGDRVSGEPYSAGIVDVCKNAKAPQACPESVLGKWEMGHWTAHGYAIASFDDISKTTVWGEGVPADINKFNGERIVLLSKPMVQRSWNCVRTFSPLGASVVVQKVLKKEEIQKYLADFGAASQEQRQKAYQEILESVNMSPH